MSPHTPAMQKHQDRLSEPSFLKSFVQMLRFKQSSEIGLLFRGNVSPHPQAERVSKVQKPADWWLIRWTVWRLQRSSRCCERNAENDPNLKLQRQCLLVRHTRSEQRISKRHWELLRIECQETLLHCFCWMLRARSVRRSWYVP